MRLPVREEGEGGHTGGVGEGAGVGGGLTRGADAGASTTPAANSCPACNNSEGKLLRCGRCKSVWFCNRDCQVIGARQGHSGANCQSADGATGPMAAPRPPAAPLQKELDSLALATKYL